MGTISDALPREAIAKALFENYESIYVVDAETAAYRCFHESDSFSTLRFENSGDDFFRALKINILRTVFTEDQPFVSRMLSKEALIAGLKEEKYYSIVYRLMINGKPLYHKLRATTDVLNGHTYILIGIRNIDKAFRLDKAYAKEISSMQNKEKTHLEAILASAEGYLEVNLTKDSILEISPIFLPEEMSKKTLNSALENAPSYSAFEQWMVDELVVENKSRYSRISNRDYLIRCFEQGEQRATVSFSVKTASGAVQPCKTGFYLYKDAPSGDIMAFCVIYDLTEQQRREKELQDLENELQLSRLRNFASQMQPHFLYNALGSIQEIVLEDPVYASRLIGDFTVHLRNCIRAMAHDAPIPFEQELENIHAYVNIEKMRFGDKLKVVFDTKVTQFSILPLSIQPIVENAIRHGIYERGEAGGTVVIRTEEDEHAWRITVEDDGVGFDEEAFRSGKGGKKDSTGLNNIMFRLDKIMHAQVSVKSRIGEGTTVTVTIPKEEESV